MNLVEKASKLATEHHAGQVDKSGRPYTEHLAHVASGMLTEEERAVAWLHDSVEDTDITPQDLHEAGFPSSVIEAVEAMTHSPNQSYEEYIQAVKKNSIARKVKIVDISHNMDLGRLPRVTEVDLTRRKQYEKALETLAK